VLVIFDACLQAEEEFPRTFFKPLGTMRPLYRTGVSLLFRERFLYI